MKRNPLRPARACEYARPCAIRRAESHTPGALMPVAAEWHSISGHLSAPTFFERVVIKRDCVQCLRQPGCLEPSCGKMRVGGGDSVSVQVRHSEIVRRKGVPIHRRTFKVTNSHREVLFIRAWLHSGMQHERLCACAAGLHVAAIANTCRWSA